MLTKYSAHREVRQILALILFSAGAGSLGCILAGLFALPAGRGWLLIAGGAALGALSYGIWNAKPWARTAAIGVSIFIAVFRAGDAVQGIVGDRVLTPAGLLALIQAAYFVFLAWLLLRKKTESLFTEARAAIERERTATP